MMKFKHFKIGLTLLLLVTTTTQILAQKKTIHKILTGYVEDWNEDIVVDSIFIFGIEITGDDTYHFNVKLKKDGQAILDEGVHEDERFFYKTRFEILKKIDEGEINALTTQVKEFSSDITPMDIGSSGKYPFDVDFLDTFMRLSHHFWIKGEVESVKFGEGYSRFTHGANAVVFYYQKLNIEGLRVVWVQLKDGMHANENERSKTNPFPTLLIITEGNAKAKFGSETITIKEGEYYFIKANQAHELWAEDGEYLEAIMIALG